MSDAYPVLEVTEHKTGRHVAVVVWNVRAISEAEIDGQTVTRIEYVNGDTLDVGMDESLVIDLIRVPARQRTRQVLDGRETVTREQVKAFADVFVDVLGGSEVFDRAFAETGLMEWPEKRRAQGRYLDTVDDIFERMMTTLREPIEDAFLEAATEVLDRAR